MAGTCATAFTAVLSTSSFSTKQLSQPWPRKICGTHPAFLPRHAENMKEAARTRLDCMARGSHASPSYSLRVLLRSACPRVFHRLHTVRAAVRGSTTRDSKLHPSTGIVQRRKRNVLTEKNEDSGGCFGGVRTKAVAGDTALDVSVLSVLDALVFDCDGVILESEDLHRRAYNATFAHFDVRCPSAASNLRSRPVVDWTTEFYDVLQNKIGGGKPKMRWYFGENGWPTSTIFPSAPQTDEERTVLIDTLQDWKTAKYKDLIASGEVLPRPGILQLMDEARALGLKIAVCSAATKSSVIFCLESLLGKDRFYGLDCFLAGDDVDKKKPDPTIYNVAATRLGVSPDRCLVVEDSVIGLQAAINAGMRCIITYTSSTKEQNFDGATAVFEDLSSVSFQELLPILQAPAS